MSSILQKFIENEIFENAIIDLNTISKIKRGDMISTRTDVIKIQHKGWVTSILRTINGDSRDEAIKCIYERVVQICQMTELLRNSRILDYRPCDEAENIVRLLRKIHTALIGAIDGLFNLKLTYEGDHTTILQLDKVMVFMEAYCDNLRRFLANIK